MKYLYFSALGLKSLVVKNKIKRKKSLLFVRKHTLILSPASTFQDKQCVFIKHKSIVSDLMPFFFFSKKESQDSFYLFLQNNN